MRLVYLSPVPWLSFLQRPHYFIKWFHQKYHGNVLWIDPYPTRLPTMEDITRARLKNVGNLLRSAKREKPNWLTVVCPRSIPIEPLPGGGILNRLLWNTLLKKFDSFTHENEYVLGIGKPSEMALQVLARKPALLSVYDAMDDFPSFYTGISDSSMRRRETEIASRVSFILVSSTTLMKRFSDHHKNTVLIHNACSIHSMPPIRSQVERKARVIFGYVGTIGHWFDWQWVTALAEQNPLVHIRLIGPIYAKPRKLLPSNIELLPSCDHETAINAMQEFSVGLIPFKRIELTNSVDPIKYYEYRAMGLPILSTYFGEMCHREGQPGVFLANGGQELKQMVQQAADYEYKVNEIQKFREENSWEHRFNACGVFPRV